MEIFEQFDFDCFPPPPQTCYVGLVAYLHGWPDVWLHFEGKRYDRNLYKFNNIYLVISYIFGYITKYLKVSPSYVLIGCLSVCLFVCCLITQKWLNRLGCNV